MPSLEFLGVGAATDFPRRETSVLYRGSATILVDCGPQIPAVLVETLPEPDALDAIYVTHRHGDHSFGLGALLLWLRTRGRTRELTVCAESSTLVQLRQLLEIGYGGAFLPSKCFVLSWHSMTEGARHELASVTLRLAPTKHNVPCHALRIDDGALSVAVSGDGLPVAQTVALYEGCDALVQECAYAEGEHEHHASLYHVATLLEVVHPRRCFLTHCLPEERARIEALVAARMGAEVTVPRRGERVMLEPSS